MISNTKANEILNTLSGRSQLSAPTAVYMGLCATEPNASTGAVSTEPSAASYERKLIGGTSNTGNQMIGSASGGKMANNVEIQFRTARQDYGARMNYWFLSTSASKGQPAYMWGRVKDVLREKAVVSGFLVDSEMDGMYSYTETVDSLLGLKEGETYIVHWDGKEYECVAKIQEVDGASAFVLTDDEENPAFAVGYVENSTGTETTGTIKYISSAADGQHTIALYGLGIEVKKETVPTFYVGELQASIDVEL